MRDLENLLKTHDWSYSYSDDFRVWSSGHAEWLLIQDKMSELGNTKEVQELYDKYEPDFLKYE